MRVAGATLVLLLLATACGPEPAPQNDERPTEPTPAPAPAPSPTPAPAPAPSPLPEGDLRGDAAEGEALYALYCVTCHGSEGKGDGPAGLSLDPRPADHSDPEYMGTLSDADLYTVISKGGPAVGKSPLMAPWGGVINDAGIRDLVAYVRSLSGS